MAGAVVADDIKDLSQLDAMLVDDDKDADEGLVYPSQKYWGLDYYFRCCLKLYISEILTVPFNQPYSGVFAYKNHPFHKVDIMGVVVGVDKRSKCQTYFVDDGTGVINCIVWNNEAVTNYRSLRRLPGMLIKKLEEIKTDRVYELGDLVQVCGKIKIFRNMREIVSNYTRKVTDPNEEWHRLQQVNKLHTQFYDKPFIVPPKLYEQLQNK